MMENRMLHILSIITYPLTTLKKLNFDQSIFAKKYLRVVDIARIDVQYLFVLYLYYVIDIENQRMIIIKINEIYGKMQEKKNR